MRTLALTVSALALVAALGCKSRSDVNNTEYNRDNTVQPSGQGGGPQSGTPMGEDYRAPEGSGASVDNATGGGGSDMSGSGTGSSGSVMGGKDAGGGGSMGSSGTGSTGGIGGGPNMGGMDTMGSDQLGGKSGTSKSGGTGGR